MVKETTAKRLTETIPGRTAAALLAVAWVASMAAVDGNAYSAWPFVVVIAVVALLFLSGMLCGGKTIRIPLTGWISLICGGYFLVRCLCSYATVDAWRESSLIVFCAVFYVAGIYGAQSKNGQYQAWILLTAVLMNVLYLYLQPGESNMLWTGRPEIGLDGQHSPPVNLFVYKNYAGAFQMLGGGLLLSIVMWLPLAGWFRLLCIALGLVSVCSAFFCNTRVVYLMGPLLIFVICLLQFIGELFTRDKVRKLTLICSILVSILFCAEAANFLAGDALRQITEIDTHGRYEMWKPVLNLALSGPCWGYGTAACHWEIITLWDLPQTPNMAHNEFLQAWGDYGIIGMGAVILIIAIHSLKGFHILSSEKVDATRRGLTGMALLVLWSMSVISFADFFWHSFAFASLTAYCCGMLASPLSGVDSDSRFREKRVSDTPIRAQGACGRAIMSVLSLGVAGFACWQSGNLSEAWSMQWEFNALEKSGTDPKFEKRLSILEQVIKKYPDSRVTDCYFTLPHYGGIRTQAKEMLQEVLRANPRQGYSLTMLVTLLGLEHRYEEAELLMRRYYPQEGLGLAYGCNWKFFYYYNLVRWSLELMEHGKPELGMSMAEYATNICEPGAMFMSRWVFRPKAAPWKKSRGIHTIEEVRSVSNKAQKKLKLLRRLEVKKDDSWMRPMEPGGKTALYPQLGIKPDKK